tara:strand:+ start:97 stop:477 length:381 start_codon:yes stop_codon:yes gene_type:complete
MRNIKTLLVGALLISTTSLLGQKETNVKPSVQKVEKNNFKLDTPEARAKHQTEQMTTMLDLTESQVPNIYNLNLKVQKKLEAIKTSSMVEEKKKEFIQGNLDDRMNTLKRLLTKHQFEEYSASFKK